MIPRWWRKGRSSHYYYQYYDYDCDYYYYYYHYDYYLKANASAAGPPLEFWWLQIDRSGGDLGCKVRSWGLWERLLMSGGPNWRLLGYKKMFRGAV